MPVIGFALTTDRRLLQMGVYNCQLYNNLGLCCFYAQQYDMTLSSFERALALAGNDEEQADVWYNIGHVAVVSEQIWKKLEHPMMPQRCTRLTTIECFVFAGHRRLDNGLPVFQTGFGF